MKIRCFVKKDGNLWVAASLEFGLTAQSCDCERSIDKLTDQIDEYVKDMNGYYFNHKDYLKNRKAPTSFYYQYYWIAFKNKFFKTKECIFDVEVNIYE